MHAHAHRGAYQVPVPIHRGKEPQHARQCRDGHVGDAHVPQGGQPQAQEFWHQAAAHYQHYTSLR